MKIRPTNFYLGTAAIVVAAVLFLLFRQQPAVESPASGQPVPPVATARPRPAPPERPAKMPEDRKARRVADLAGLKQRWMALKGRADRKAEAEALAAESARLLLCSDETLDLMLFLSEQGFADERLIFETKVFDLFASPLAAEARESLLGMSDRAKEMGSDFREYWSYPAGVGCPPEEFEAFRARLEAISPGYAQEALFGRNKTLVKTDPKAALTSTLEQLQKHIGSRQSERALLEQMRELPGGLDFKEIDALFPAVDPTELNAINKSRPAFFEKWGAEDPAAAAEYVMSKPGRFKPEWVAPIAGQVMSKFGMESGIEWVQQFPPGPYLDWVVSGSSAYIYFDHPDQAKALALKVQDEKMRTRILDKIERVRKSVRNGESR